MHKDKQYFHEFGSNLNGISHHFEFISNLHSQMLMKAFIICFDLYMSVIAYALDRNP